MSVCVMKLFSSKHSPLWYTTFTVQTFREKLTLIYILCLCVCLLTVSPWQVFMKVLPVLFMQDVVHAGVDKLLLLVLQVLGHVVRHKHDAALPVHHEQEAIQSLQDRNGRAIIIIIRR